MSPTSTITLNGKAHGVVQPLTIEDLLQSLGMQGKPVVVELDEEAVFPRDFAHTEVCPGSRVEVIVLAAGG